MITDLEAADLVIKRLGECSKGKAKPQDYKIDSTNPKVAIISEKIREKTVELGRLLHSSKNTRGLTKRQLLMVKELDKLALEQIAVIKQQRTIN